MNSLASILKGILNFNKKIDLKTLPSQGIFYKDDFEITIKKADIEDIVRYEHQYDKEDIGIVITRVKGIVQANVILSEGYGYQDIKSIDIVYLFLEIVKFTNNKEINIKYFNNEIGENDEINFNSSTFNYAKIDDSLLKTYDSTSKEFVIDGFKYSVPCIGAENSLTNFLIEKSGTPNSEIYNDFSYDFLYFLGHKSFLNFDEIDNLIQIFNYDLPIEDQKKVRKIIKQFSNIGRYTLKNNSMVIEVTAKIDLEKIWKV